MKAPILAIVLLLSLPAMAQTTKPAAPVPTDANFAALDALAKQDYDRAIRLWRPLAARGDKEAQYQLGLLASANGPQDLRNPSEARLWLGRAAEQGHIQAQYQYGLALAWGDSTRPNREGARQWLEKARDAGHPNASSALEQLGTIPDTALAAGAVSAPPPPPRAMPEPAPLPVPAPLPEPARQPSVVTSEPLARPAPPPVAAAPLPVPPPPAAVPQPVAPPPPLPVTADLPPAPPEPRSPPAPVMPATDIGPSIGELLSSGFNRPAAPSRDGGVLPAPAKPEALATTPAPLPPAPPVAAPPPAIPETVAPPVAAPAPVAPISPPPPPVAALVQMPAPPTPAQALEADYIAARRPPGWQPRIVTDGAAQPSLPLMSPPPPVRDAVTVDLAALPPTAPTPTSPVTLIRPGSAPLALQPTPAASPPPTAMAQAAPTPLTPIRPAPSPAPVPTPAAAMAPTAGKPAAATGGEGWRIRFAVLSKESSIPGTLTAYREKADAFLGEESITIEPVSASGPWRIFLNGHYEKSDAERRCSGIKKTGLDCLVTR